MSLNTKTNEIYLSKIPYRYINQRVRYYKIQLTKTLFEEYLLTKEYGSMTNRKSTKIIQEFYHFKEKALWKFKNN